MSNNELHLPAQQQVSEEKKKTLPLRSWWSGASSPATCPHKRSTM